MVIGLLIVASVSFSVFAIINGIESYFNTITYLFDFAFGGLAAVLIFKNKKIDWLKNLSGAGCIIFYSYLLLHFTFFYFLDKFVTGTANDFVALISRYLFIIYIALLIAEQMINVSRMKFMEKNRFMVFTGKLSYGLYCFHGITITFINLLLARFGISNWIMVIIYFSINYLIASISYFYLESPFLKLKAKWRRT